MATGEDRSSCDYDEYTEEPGGGRAHSRYVNVDTIQASDSDDDRRMPQSPTEETMLSAAPEDDSAATSGEHRPRDSHSSSDEENDQSKSSGKMAKLFGKTKKKSTKDKPKEKKDKKDKENKKEKKEEKKEKEDKKEKKEKKEEKKDKKEKKEEAKEKKEKKKKEKKEEKEKKDEEKPEEKIEPFEVKEKEKPREKSPHRMPGFGKLGGIFKRNKKDSNTSNDSDITPPKLTSTPPSHRYTDDVPRDISSDAPHDQTFQHSEHSGATSAAANSDVFDEPEKVPLEEMDPRTRFRGPPPETIPMPMMGEPMGYVPPPMVPVSEAHVPPIPEDTTAPKTVPYTYTKDKTSLSYKIRAPFNKILADKRSAKFQQGDGVAELNPSRDPPIVRCSTFLVVVLVSGFILGIILTAMSSLSDTLAVVGPCFIGLSFFGLIGKIFFTLWWEEDPLPPLNKFNDQFHGFISSGPNYQKDTYEAYPMYPVHSSQAALATHTVQSEVSELIPMTNEPAIASDDDVPDIGLRFTDSDMDYVRDSSGPSPDDSIEAYKRMRRDSFSSDENMQSTKPSFV